MSSISRATTLLILALVCGLLAPVGAVADFSGFPGGDFADQPVVSADEMRLAEGSDPQPTSIAWLPDGDLLVITQQGGLFRDDGSSVVELLDLSQDICSFRDSTDRGEMGLLGLAVDPNFNDTGNIFLYYTDRKTGNRCANRVARYRIEDEQAELVDILVDNIRAPGNHNAGDLQFGRDKLLYISVGDGGTDFRTGKPQDENGNARRLDLLNGKILRITAEGAIPAGNPFQGPRTGRCHTAGQLEQQGQRVELQKKSRKQKRKARKRKRKQQRNQRPATICQEIFATGLRNPYRIAFDPNDNAGPQRFFINDVGGGGFEEINEGQAGADYGWNVREGFCPIGNIGSNCSGSGQFDDPIFAYRTRGTTPPFNECGTITGGAFVAGGDWPADYLFADFRCDTLFALSENGSGVDVDLFATGEGATHLAFGPDGALYYTTFSDGGQVRKIVDQ